MTTDEQDLLPIDDAVNHNRDYVATHGVRQLPTEPSKRLAIVTCMDSRLDLFGALGLDLGEAHIIRNAGGLATDDVIRSLILSERMLGTQRIMLIQHTRCGLNHLDESLLNERISDDTGQPSTIEFGSFQDIGENIRMTATRLRNEPALTQIEVRAFVFDVDTGALEEIDVA
jgi:carbonic anhydrase